MFFDSQVRAMKENNAEDNETDSDMNEATIIDNMAAVLPRDYAKVALKIERASRFSFPSTFLIICIIYWLVMWKA